MDFKRIFEGVEMTATTTGYANKYGNIFFDIRWGELEMSPTFRSMDAFHEFWADDDRIADLVNDAAHNS